MPAVTVGFVLAVVVLVLSVLGVLGIIPASPVVVFAMIGAVAVCRLI